MSILGWMTVNVPHVLEMSSTIFRRAMRVGGLRRNADAG